MIPRRGLVRGALVVALIAGCVACGKKAEIHAGATKGGAEGTTAAAAAAAKPTVDPRQAIRGRWQVARDRVEASPAYTELAKVDGAGAKRMLDALALLTVQISERELRIEGPGPARRVFFEVGAVDGSTIELKPTGKGAPMTIEVGDQALVLKDRANKLPLILRPAPTPAAKTEGS